VFATLGRTGNALDETVFTGAPRFLEIVVQGETLSPRLPINSTPYAVRSTGADSADRLGTLAPDDVVTTINAGTGLMGGGSGNTVGLSIDSTTVQSRVTGTCSAGQSIRAIDATGAVTCEVDNDTTYSALSGGGVAIDGSNQISTDTTVQRRTATTNNMTCPAGQFMRAIDQTGQVTCVPAISCTLVYQPASSISNTVYCPSGRILMGGGCGAAGGIIESHPGGGQGWVCRTGSGNIDAYAICCSDSL